MPVQAERPLMHMVAFDVPFPPNYGGVIDIWHRINALHDEGIGIILHCFEYGRGRWPELETVCEKVIYYPRKALWKGFFSRLPMIVHSRMNRSLLQNLISDDLPVWLEGLHCTGWLESGDLAGKKVFIRMHNDEAGYYRLLASRESDALKRFYFNTESKRLARYEKVIASAEKVLFISPVEQKRFSETYSNTSFLPPFHGHSQVISATGKGDFVLYHGNLTVNENREAVLYLLEHVFPKLSTKVIIAGRAPDKSIRQKVSTCENVELIADPDTRTMEELIANAHIHTLVTFQETGMKLKLMQVLFRGRHCVVNREMVSGTGLEPACVVCENSEQLITHIDRLMDIPFSPEDLALRQHLLKAFSDKEGARLILDLL